MTQNADLHWMLTVETSVPCRVREQSRWLGVRGGLCWRVRGQCLPEAENLLPFWYPMKAANFSLVESWG